MKLLPLRVKLSKICIQLNFYNLPSFELHSPGSEFSKIKLIRNPAKSRRKIEYLDFREEKKQKYITWSLSGTKSDFCLILLNLSFIPYFNRLKFYLIFFLKYNDSTETLIMSEFYILYCERLNFIYTNLKFQQKLILYILGQIIIFEKKKFQCQKKKCWEKMK